MDWLQKPNRREYIAREYACLDIETAWNHDIDNPRGWIVSIQWLFNGRYYLYRKPSEFIKYLRAFVDYYGINDDHVLYIYIHNASYDLTYLMQWLIKEFGDDYNLLAINTHKIISFEIAGLCFRCSYKLSNKSLDKWARDMNTAHKKAVGSYDYNRVIYQDTELSREMIQYDKLDVVVLNEAIERQLLIYNDTTLSVPLTSTGYIRRIARDNSKRYKQRKHFLKTKLNAHTYSICRAGFHGGYTHLNRYLASKLLKANDLDPEGWIAHGDFRSHYPSQQRCYNFPIGKPFVYYSEEDKASIEDIFKLEVDYCFYVLIELENLHIIDGVTMPMLATYKCRTSAERSEDLRIVDDNGRVLHIYKGHTQVVVSNLMLHILEEQYTFDYTIIEALAFEAGALPSYLIDTIDTFFKGKSDLKEKHRQLAEELGAFDPLTIEANTDLMKAKNGLNGIFGMTCTDIVRTEYEYVSNVNEWRTNRSDSDMEEIQARLDKYYKSRNNFMSYQLGCWVTELAQFELYEYLVKCIGYDRAIYCDTDSIFYYSNETIEKNIEALNEEKRKNAEARKAFVESNGRRIYYDVFEQEDRIQEFKGLHSKCYGIVTEKGEFILTIAGVTADNGKQGAERVTREQELGSLDNLRHGFTFRECGGTRAIYTQEAPHIDIIDGHEVEIANACIIAPVEKTLSCFYSEWDIDRFIVYEKGE